MQLLTLLFWSVALAATASAAESPTAEKPYFITRALRIAPTVQILTNSAIFPKASQTGTGVSVAYELVTSPPFAISIHLAGRVHPGEEAVAQLGYGLLLKHYLYNTRNEEAAWRPYWEYGLLLQITWAHDRSGSATAHDTRTGLGMDFKLLGTLWYLGAHYHFSTAKLFDSESFSLNRVETELGIRLRW